MKRLLSAFAISSCLLFCACTITAPREVPVGTWNYDLLVNDVKMGHAVISNTINNEHYIYTFNLSIGNDTTYSRYTITETLDCQPVRLEKQTLIQQETTHSKINIIAEPKGKTITLFEDNRKSTITLEDDFIFDGNYFLHQLIRSNFKKGTTIQHNIYDPSIEREAVIPVTMTLEDTETISVNSVLHKAWRVNQSIGNIKNIIIYLNDKGVVLKSSITMLNLKMDIILKD